MALIYFVSYEGTWVKGFGVKGATLKTLLVGR
ncbi:hypothetical protein L349_06307 [Enterobacter sp. MGH 3]|uniref:Uncharacterized protein n=1 Tax=Enterobacter hormaechei TaxID=158836 RepID=A0ABD7L1R3_9ENTR|nr:hypothetical protein L360_03506 [Enterobacter sp. MGH 14]EUN09427.1 hypothetical protein L349_06307 [Enterobacter sp. MGH 3]KLW89770.1 hypothetical protein SK61_00621 [Enterobacter sp. BIDMC100]OUF14499.1 hypothetical protein AZ020_001363 [Enterobacter hormaechei]CAE7781107.1 hypothetical protein AI2796V1_3594 [Enterobacter cloacae]